MNQRDIVLSLLDLNQKPPYLPAAFFLHFGPDYQRGQAAVDRHLAYFRHTGMDFVKIQYEHPFPPVPNIRRPGDWAKMPFHKLDFYQEPLRVVEGLVKAAKAEALVVLTLYSPFMFAGQVAGDRVVEHIRQDPEQVKRGMEIITESLKLFVRECIHLGLDGFYTSTQGGEAGRLTVGSGQLTVDSGQLDTSAQGGKTGSFNDRTLFDACIRPYDLALMEEANRGTLFNILHVCDYHLPYASLAPYKDYPGQVVSAGLELTGGKLSPQEVSRLFGRPFLGGLDRKGVIATGSQEEIRRAVEALLTAGPERFILGADCTVPGETPWDNLKTAISTAHSFKNRG